MKNSYLDLSLTKMQRIMLIGRPGSGKSTYAVKLQKILNIPVFHLDKYYFLDNWIPRNHQEFLAIQQQLIALPRWIIDGCSTRSYEMRYSQADICLYFNISKWYCCWRLFKRRFDKHPDIDDRAPNCHETFSWSLIKYLWNFEKKVSSTLKQLQLDYPQVKFIELRSDNDATKIKNLLATYIR